MIGPLIEAIADMRDDDAVSLATNLLAEGTPPVEVLSACNRGMALVGARFEAGEYFVPELILAGEMLRQIAEVMKAHLGPAADEPRLGTVLLGTVAGDIHDIGKDLVHFMLDVNGFEVVDLGVDVPPETFVAKVREVGPQVVALSGFLRQSHDAMRQTVQALTEAGLRDRLAIMVGGGNVDEGVRSLTGADAVGADAMDAVALARRLVGAA